MPTRWSTGGVQPLETGYLSVLTAAWSGRKWNEKALSSPPTSAGTDESTRNTDMDDKIGRRVVIPRGALEERLRPEAACATVDQSDDRRKWYG